MFENGAFWSRRVRTCSQAWWEDGRGVWMFMGLIPAVADGDGAAGGGDRLLGERDVGDLLDRRLVIFVDIAVLGAVVDRPLRAGAVEAGIDRPDAISG